MLRRNDAAAARPAAALRGVITAGVLTWARRLQLLAPVLILAALAGWAVATPVGSSPDEDFHLASIWCGAGDRAGLCEPGATEGQKRVPEALLTSPCYERAKTKTGSCQHLDDQHLVSTKRVNATSVYPPVYYAVTAVFASHNIAGSVIAIRLFNSVLFVGLGTALFAMLRRERRTGLVLTWAAALVPLGTFLVPSVNPSSWAITGCATAWFAGVGFFESHGRRRAGFGVLAVVGCVLAAGSRADAAVYALLAVGAAWFASGGTRRGPRWIVFALPAAVVVFALALWLLPGQSSIFTQGFGSKNGPGGFGLLFQNLINVPLLWLGTLGVANLGSLGWFDIQVPFAAQAAALLAFLCVAVWGLRGGSPRRLIVMGLWAVVLLVVPLWTLQISHAQVGTFLQPRYLYPVVILLAAAAATIGHGPERPSTLQLTSLGIAAALANTAVLYGAIRRFSIADPTRVDFALSSHEKWWWAAGVPGPMTVWVIASLAFAAAIAILLIAIAAPPPNVVPRAFAAGRHRPLVPATRPRAHVRGRRSTSD